MSTFLRPSGDLASIGWSEAPFWSKLNDSAPNDATYIWAAGNDSQVTMTLSSGGTPDVGAVRVRVRARDPGAFYRMTMQLFQDEALVASREVPLTASWVTREFTLTSAEANSITSWGDLRVKFRVDDPIAEGGYVETANGYGAVLVLADSVSGATWSDEGGSDLHATLVGTPTWSASGGPGAGLPGYLALNGSSQYADVGDQALLKFTQDVSICAWLRVDGAAQQNWAQMVGKGPDYMVRTYGSDADREDNSVQWEAPDGDCFGGASVLPDNGWKYVMARRIHGGSDPHSLDLHVIDALGEPELLATNSVAVPDLSASINHFMVGAQERSASGQTIRRFWRGHVAGVAVFGGVLSTAAFKQLYQAAVSS